MLNTLYAHHHGDREETAINIAVACQLLWTEARMHRTVINVRDTDTPDPDEIKKALEGTLGYDD